MKHTKLLAALASLALSGCACDMDLGHDPADAGRDAGTFTPRTDECGNGIDDDQNGRIDDGCWCGTGETQSCFSGPYPGHRVGACRDGTQTCEVQEFGDWGTFSCIGQTLPSAELCDEIDNDCDGAVDEDCPCPAATSRMCSDEFATAPCMPGTQTCRAGTWSRCEGAVVPSADICEDAIDNDCDGVTNEGCGCRSVPEVCGDGMDNDCDGDIDELPCAPLPDAGMSLPDAGSDAAIPLGVDAGMPGPDAGYTCEGATGICLGRPAALEMTMVAPRAQSGTAGQQIATDGTNLFVLSTEGASGHDGLRLLVLGADGAIRTDVLVADWVLTSSMDLVWNGTNIVVAWIQSGPFGSPVTFAPRYAVLRLDGTFEVPATDIDVAGEASGGEIHMARGPAGLAFVWARYRDRMLGTGIGMGMFQRRHLDGSADGAPIMLGDGVDPTSLAAQGTGFVVGTRHFLRLTSARPEYQSQVRWVSGGAVTQLVELPLDTYAHSSGARLAASCDRALACWRDDLSPPGTADGPTITRCQAFDASGAMVSGPTVLLGGQRSGNLAYAHLVDVVWADGQFLVRTEASYPYTTDPRAIDPRGEVYTALSADGSILWSEPTERRGVGYSYEYGDMLWDGSCAVSLMWGTWTGSLSPSLYSWGLRRTCQTACP